jgi:hypothetical protein
VVGNNQPEFDECFEISKYGFKKNKCDIWNTKDTKPTYFAISSRNVKT